MERCPLCGSPERGIRYPDNRPPVQHAGGFYRCTSVRLGLHADIFQCADCGLLYNEAASGNLHHLEEYERVEDPAYLVEREARRVTYARELEQIEALTTGRDLLDVGCYAGFFLEQAQERGWRVAGVEPSRWAAQHARALGLEVHRGSVEEYVTERKFDVVTLWDVIEHLEDPLAVLQRVRSLLNERGILVFTTHKVDSWAARIMRSRYPLFMEMHTIHLSSQTRNLLLERSGFRLIHHHRHSRALRVDYLLSRLGRFGRVPEHLSRRCAQALGLHDRFLWIGFMGLETVIARPDPSS